MSLDLDVEKSVLIERCKKGNYEIPEDVETAEGLRESIEVNLTATMGILMDSKTEFELVKRYNTYNEFVKLYGGNSKSINELIKN